MKKRILSVLLAALIVASASVAVAPVAEFSTVTASAVSSVSDFTYTVDNGIVTITGYNGTETDIEIPGTIDDKPVVVGDRAFSGKNITSVVIDEGVTSIGSQAFYSCQKITSVSLPSTLTTIGDSAFGYNYKLTSLTLPDKLETIGNSSFRNCNNITTSITIPASVKTIGSYAFCACTQVPEFIFKSDDTTFKNDCFNTCQSITSFKFPANMTSVPNYALSYCSALTSVTFPSKVTSIGNAAFSYCSKLTSVTIPASVNTLGTSIFANCTALTSVNIPEAITKIPPSMFSFCTSLTTMPIHNKITEIGSSAFSNSGITSLTFPDSVTTINTSAFSNCKGLTTVSIPATIKTLNSNVFSGCTSLKTAEIKSTETKLSDHCFSSCTALTDVSLPSGMTVIPSNFFYNCTSLANIDIPETVETINNSAFRGTAITTVKLPAGLKTIGSYLFYGCQNLTGVEFPDAITSIPDNTFNSCPSLKSLPITSKIKSIGTYAFSSCTGLTEVTIPDTVTSIGNYCFNACSNLTKITLPSGLTSVPNSLCSSCTKLTDVTIPESVKTIGSSAFYGCSSLVSINLPNNLETIGASAFNNAKALESITIPEKVTTINDNAFSSSGLKTITIPASVTTFGNYVFSSCTNLTGVKFNNQMEKIPNGTFYYCSNMTEYKIPEGIKSLGSYAFYGASKLMDLYFPRTFEKFENLTNFPNNKDMTLYGYEGTIVKETAESKDFHYVDRENGYTEYTDKATGVSIRGDLPAGTTVKITKLENQYFEYPTSIEIIPDFCYDIRFIKDNKEVAPLSNVVVFVPTDYEKLTTLKAMFLEGAAETGAAAAFTFNNGTLRTVIPAGGIFAAQEYANLKILPIMSRTVISKYMSVDLSAKAAGASGANYRYAFYTRPTGTEEWTTQKTYSTTNTCTFKPGEIGTYDILFKAKENNGKETEQILTLKVNDTIRNTSTIKNSDIVLNEKFVMNGSATLGTEEYLYTYSITPIDANGNLGTEVIIEKETANTKVEYKPASVGKYQLRIVAHDAVSGGASIVNYKVEVHEQLRNNSSVSGVCIVNNNVTINAKASGGVGTLKYTYYYKKSDSSTWNRIGEEDVTATTATFKPGSIAKYDIKVVVKDSQNRTLDKVFSINVIKDVTNLSTVSTTKAYAGDTITIYGKSEGGTGSHTYTYAYKKSTSSTWTKIDGDYSTKTEVTFVPATAADYLVKVTAFDVNKRKDEKTFTVNVGKALSNKSTVSSTSVPQNTNVIVTGGAADGAGGYKYAFYYKKSTSAAWQSIGEIYGNTKSVSFVPATVAKYLVKVNVKDANGKVVTKQFTINSTKPSGNDLVNKSKLDKTTVVRNNPIKITGIAAGGSGGYKYAFYYKKADSKAFTAIGTEYGNASTATFTPASSGKYSVRINVKDSSGTIVTKQYTIVSEPANS